MNHRLVVGLGLVAVLLVVGCSGDEGECARRALSAEPIGSGQAVVVPDVTGIETSEADVILQQIGLLMIVEAIGGDDAVIRCQNPPAEATVGKGSTVYVEARCYPAPCPFPGEEKAIYDPCTCAAR